MSFVLLNRVQTIGRRNFGPLSTCVSKFQSKFSPKSMILFWSRAQNAFTWVVPTYIDSITHLAAEPLFHCEDLDDKIGHIHELQGGQWLGLLLPRVENYLSQHNILVVPSHIVYQFDACVHPDQDKCSREIWKWYYGSIRIWSSVMMPSGWGSIACISGTTLRLWVRVGAESEAIQRLGQIPTYQRLLKRENLQHRHKLMEILKAWDLDFWPWWRIGP